MVGCPFGRWCVCWKNRKPNY